MKAAMVVNWHLPFSVLLRRKVRRWWGRGLVAMALLPAVGSTGADQHALKISTEHYQLVVEVVARGLERPWGMAFPAADEFLVTARGGKLLHIFAGEVREIALPQAASVAVTGQGGLLDIVLHPEFDDNGRLYLSYARGDGNGFGTAVAMTTLQNGVLSGWREIFSATPQHRGGRHFGSRLAFDASGYLYISLGDRGQRSSAQDLLQHAGSIIRLHDDGRVPADNPVISAGDALPEIYSYGHRNVQGMAFDSANGVLWAHEHGPQGGDELNRVVAGANYGWPTITYGVNYGSGSSIGEGTSKPGMQQPETFWVPSIAPSGMAVVRSDTFADWDGDVLVGALKFQLLVRVDIVDGRVVGEERMLEGELGRIRDVRLGPDGFVYLLTDARNGALYRLRPE